MPILSKVKQYELSEIDLASISLKSQQTFGRRPFQWQLKAAQSILMGKDTILDVGTGSGKTLCFSLPLLLSLHDIGLTISPLTALMIDQVSFQIS